MPLTAVFRTHVLAYALLGVFAGLYLFYLGFRLLLRKRLIENTPASKIRSASIGLVEVNGLAVGPHTLQAPVTGLPCYLYRTLAWEWRQEGKNSQWIKTADETLHLPFFLDDNTGRLLIDPQGAEMNIHRDYCEEFSQSLFAGSLDVPANIAGFLSRHGVNCNGRIKVEEYCIKPKNALFVLGTLSSNHSTVAGASPIRTVPEDARKFPLQFSIRSSHFSPVATFTMGTRAEITSAAVTQPAPPLDPARRQAVTVALIKAGITNPAAWAAAGITEPFATSAAAVALAPDNSPEAQFDLHPPVVLMKGAHNPAFFISWQSQRDVVRSLGWKSTLMIWGGPALSLFCMYLLAEYFNWL